MGTGIDVECEADFLLRPFDGAVPGARALLARHFGEGCVTVVPMKGHGDAELVTLHGKPHVCLRSKLSKIATRWALCHELAEWRLDQLDYREEDREEVAEGLAAALVTPRRALFRELGARGRDLPALANAFVTTQTSLALRLGEARCVDASVVVRPGLVRVRAPDGYALPGHDELRRLAKGAPSPLDRHVLTDDRRRIALLAG